MKMHPKPMIRHTWPIIECKAEVVSQHEHQLPIHIILTIDGRTQRVCMSVDEADTLRAALLRAAVEA